MGLDQKKAQQLLKKCSNKSRKTVRIGITGSPGVGNVRIENSQAIAGYQFILADYPDDLDFLIKQGIIHKSISNKTFILCSHSH